MSRSEARSPGKPKRPVFPRWLAPIYFALLIPLALVAAPWAISRLLPRYGWDGGRPGLLNLLPLTLVVAGVACVIWIVALHFVEAPHGWELERTPKYLLTRGPYRFTRNPSFLSLLAVLAGWALFYGSLSIVAAALVAWVGMNFVVVPQEERELERRFGQAYLRYKARVPRWIGVARP